MVERVNHTRPESLGGEEVVLLTESVELRVSIKHPCTDELVEDSDDERREEGEGDVVKGEGPSFHGDLTGEVVEEGVLSRREGKEEMKFSETSWQDGREIERVGTDVELSHVENDVLVERVCAKERGSQRRETTEESRGGKTNRE